MEVLIVGAGAMGRWVAETLEASVAFADVDEEAAETAAEEADGRAVPLESAAPSESFDAVCVAVPMGHVRSAVEAHAPRAERAVLDVSGAMAPALEAMGRHAPELERLSLHPLFAPERAPGNVAAVRAKPGPVTDAILADLEAGGNEVLETTAEAHDEAMETVQAAAHAAILAFALAAEPVPEGFETPVYEGMRDLAETVTGNTPRVYADIQETFDGADAVADAAASLAGADPAELEALYREASARWNAAESTRRADRETESESSP